MGLALTGLNPRMDLVDLLGFLAIVMNAIFV